MVNKTWFVYFPPNQRRARALVVVVAASKIVSTFFEVSWNTPHVWSSVAQVSCLRSSSLTNTPASRSSVGASTVRKCIRVPRASFVYFPRTHRRARDCKQLAVAIATADARTKTSISCLTAAAGGGTHTHTTDGAHPTDRSALVCVRDRAVSDFGGPSRG